MSGMTRKERRIHKNDDVLVITGTSRGREGKVLSIDHKKCRVTVEGINKVWKHLRKSQEHPQGARIQREAPIHISNVRRIIRKKDEPDEGTSSGGKD